MKKLQEVYTEKLVTEIRKENEKAKASIKSSGISFTNPEAAAVAKIKMASNKVAENLVGKLIF
ncbi:MAG: hypothetical protein KatS3mg068_2430 [Candidatus Sericytochromatia bacterium]|nr:MAG: hypothetical protein KatS3mg068_2430 [Candidatus Sericytochromatia bacterium]